VSHKNNGSISCWDVVEWLRVIEKDYHCRVHYHIAPPMREGTGLCFVVRVAATRYAVGAQPVWERGISSQWPNREAVTFMGLLLRITLELEHKLAIEFGGNGTATDPSQGRMDF
jgi:hypothetical protein